MMSTSHIHQPAAPQRPHLPDVGKNLVSDTTKVQQIQAYIEEFEYNYSGKPFLKLNKNGGAKHLQTAAQELIRLSLPIQCVEAVFIGCWLSKDMLLADRVPLSFKSRFRGNIHRHIVLAVRCQGKWGAIGISRRPNLMYKPVQYDSLVQMIQDYEASYEECFHQLLTVYIGLPVPRVFDSDDRPIKWRAAKIRLCGTDVQDITDQIDKYCSMMNQMERHYMKYGRLPS